MRIVTYFTEGIYEQIANNLIIPSAKKVGVDLFKIKIPSKHTWKKNTSMKASCILSAIEELNDDVVMIDADAEFVQYPSLFTKILPEYDVAYHNLDVDWFWRGTKGTKRQLATGTIMFRNSPKCKKLLTEWIIENDRNPEVLEQKNLENLINREYSKNNLLIYQLPIEYLAMTHKDGNVPSFIKDPVIIHRQASRTTKRMEL
jgi:hypothetical protein